MVYAAVTGRAFIGGVERVHGYAFKLKDGWKIVARHFQINSDQVWEIENVKWYKNVIDAKLACLNDGTTTDVILFEDYVV